MSEHATDPALEVLLEHLRRSRGVDFTAYKRSTVQRRIGRRLDDLKVESIGAYRDYLDVHPEELQALLNTVLINVTSFLRDPEAWSYLASEILPRLIAKRLGGEPIRIWSAGCASGEEPFTIAMLMAEALGESGLCQRVEIYATDVDEDALATARQGAYSTKALEDLPEVLRAKYFDGRGPRRTVCAELRRAVIVGRHDLIADSPISRLDLIVCRNTLMYFNADAQKKILTRCHHGLADGGFLFLGRAELLLGHGDLFRLDNLAHRIFDKVPLARPREP